MPNNSAEMKTGHEICPLKKKEEMKKLKLISL